MARVKRSTLKNFRDLLGCPICTELMLPPVYQCATGHILCSTCKNKVSRCPTCQDSLLGIRCFFADKVMECLEVPCKYQSSGCRMIDYTNMLTHEEQCSYRPFSCPVSSSCGDRVDEYVHLNPSMNLERHLGRYHQSTSHRGAKIDIFIVLSGSSHPPPVPAPSPLPPSSSCASLHSCFNKVFCLFWDWVGTDARCIRVSLSIIGDKYEATTFRYRLRVGEANNCLSWRGFPRSVRERPCTSQDRDSSSSSGDGLIVPLEMVGRFNQSNLEGLMRLHVSGAIWKDFKKSSDCRKRGRSTSKPKTAEPSSTKSSRKSAGSVNRCGKQGSGTRTSKRSQTKASGKSVEHDEPAESDNDEQVSDDDEQESDEDYEQEEEDEDDEEDSEEEEEEESEGNDH